MFSDGFLSPSLLWGDELPQQKLDHVSLVVFTFIGLKQITLIK